MCQERLDLNIKKMFFLPFRGNIFVPLDVRLTLLKNPTTSHIKTESSLSFFFSLVHVNG